MKPKYSFEKSVGGVIFRMEKGIKKYLLIQYGAGHWEYPRGHQKKGESDAETLRREVKEETGIGEIIIVPGFRKKGKFIYHAKGDEEKRRIEKGKGTFVIKDVVYYLAETKEKKVKISYEHKAFKWLPYAEALKKVTYKNSKKVLEEANNFLLDNK
jgi:bis(5'-nucleosidyl)-tetraphosphatase